MRNPERIDKILGAISHVWREQPDLRLCQLIVNLVGDPRLNFDVHSVEDDVLYNELFAMAKRLQKECEGQSDVSDTPPDL